MCVASAQEDQKIELGPLDLELQTGINDHVSVKASEANDWIHLPSQPDPIEVWVKANGHGFSERRRRYFSNTNWHTSTYTKVFHRGLNHS